MANVMVACDNCNKKIDGFRYKCLECNDFDLCRACESVYHSGHVMFRFTNPLNQLDKEFLEMIMSFEFHDKPFLIQGSHDFVQCYICGSDNIEGYVYTCVDCPNVNLCSSCEKKTSQCVSGKAHLLIRFADPLTLNSYNRRFWKEILNIRKSLCGFSGEQELIEDTVKHYGAMCDACNNDVVGLRFKCIDCPDYDLCVYCEPKNMHSGHLLARLGKPLETSEQSFFKSIVKWRSAKKRKIVLGGNCGSYSSHYGVTCNNCNTTIRGFRYKCLECDNYDSCSLCQKQDYHTQHLMIRFTQPINQQKESLKFLEAVKEISKPNANGSTPMQELSCTISRINSIWSLEDQSNTTNGSTSITSTSSSNENSQGRLIQNCTICRMIPSDILFLDCGHLCICSQCITTYRNSAKNCPICRLPIKSAHRAYY